MRGPGWWRDMRRADLALGLVAAMVRLVVVWRYLPHPPVTETMQVGFTLAHTGRFADPFIVATGPTAHVAPLYPALIGLAAWLVGNDRLGFDLVRSLVALAFGLFVALLPQAAARLGMGRRAGWWTAVLFTPSSIPLFVWIETSGQHEGVLTMFLLAAALSATIAVVRAGRWDHRDALRLGVLWGIGFLCSPVLLPVLVVVLGVAALRGSGPVLPRLRHGVVVGLVALGITVPWIVRNAIVLGRPSFVRDNLSLELHVSNSDVAVPDMRANMELSGSMRTHPYFNGVEAMRMRRMGELAYYDEKGREARTWIATHPARFAALTLAHLKLFFFPEWARKFNAPFYAFSLLLGLVGLVRCTRRSPVTGLMLGGAIAAYAVPYLVVQGHERYSYPVLWLWTLPACWVASDALAWGVARLRARRVLSVSHAR